MKRLLLWGTGSRAEQFVRQLQDCPAQIVAFIDSDSARHGELHGRPVIGPEAAAALRAGEDYDTLVIASVFYDEIYRKALSLGFPASALDTASLLHFLPMGAKMTPEQFSQLSSVPWWYHGFEVLPGVHTPGCCPYKPWLLDRPYLQDLAGQRVLDIGAWDGPYTLEMSRRGAEVSALDIQLATHSGFDAMRRANGLDVTHFCDSVYQLDPQTHGVFDLVTFFGVYYHLRNPVAALININAVLRPGGLVLVEGAILEGAPTVDEHWADKADLVRSVRDIPLGFYVKGTYEGEWSNWWVPNLTCLRHWMESCGFEVLDLELVEVGTRGFCIARKVSDVPREHMVLQGACAMEPGV